MIDVEVPDERTVVLRLHVDADPAAVYAAFTETASLSSWFWPERLAPLYDVDGRVGGTLRAHSDVADMGLTATFLELVPDRTIVLDWRWDGGDAVTSVRIDLENADPGTQVTVRHAENPSTAARDEHRQGWTDCLNRLAAESLPRSGPGPR